MTRSRPVHATPARTQQRSGGFSLIEIMIALTLGLLLSIGIISLFDGTSRTNKLQNGLAQLQENGRFAVMKIEQDMRMLGAQYCSNTTGGSAPGTAVPVLPERAPMIYAPNLNLPDSTIQSIDAAGNPSNASATAAYALSPRWFAQGYACTASTCTPALPVGVFPGMGLAAGMRVPASDVLTVRYLRGSGWPLESGACSIGAAAPILNGTAITVSPQTGDDPVDISPGELALVTDCINPVVLPISAVSSNTLTVGGGVLDGVTGAVCSGNRTRDVRLFNFSRDFVTVSYYLVFRADDNPDARPNGGGGTRLIPVLVRRENGVEQELVRGVDQLAFRYGIQDSAGSTRFMTADQVGAGGAFCTAPPPGMNVEPGCLWRSVRTVEAHLLVNTVNEVFGLDTASRTYRFDGTSYTRADGDALPSGLLAGSQLRREFIAYVSSRAHNL